MILGDLILPITNLGGPDYAYRIENLKTLARALPRTIHLIIIELEVSGNQARGGEVKDFVVPGGEFTYLCYKGETFNKSHFYNIGVEKAKSQAIFLGESDIFVDPSYFGRVLKAIEENDLKWAICWNQIAYLNEEWSEPEKIFWCQYKKAEGGLVYFDKDFYYEIGGANDFMNHVAGVDNEIVRRAENVTKTYNTINEHIFHLWHPESKIRQGKSPYFYVNKQMCDFANCWADKMIDLLKDYPIDTSNPRHERTPWDQLDLDKYFGQECKERLPEELKKAANYRVERKLVETGNDTAWDDKFFDIHRILEEKFLASQIKLKQTQLVVKRQKQIIKKLKTQLDNLTGKGGSSGGIKKTGRLGLFFSSFWLDLQGLPSRGTWFCYRAAKKLLRPWMARSKKVTRWVRHGEKILFNLD